MKNFPCFADKSRDFTFVSEVSVLSRYFQYLQNRGNWHIIKACFLALWIWLPLFGPTLQQTTASSIPTLESFIQVPLPETNVTPPTVYVDSTSSMTVGCTMKHFGANATIREVTWASRHPHGLVVITSVANPQPEDEHKYHVTTAHSNPQGTADQSILTVYNVEEKDGGEYFCSYVRDGRKIESYIKMHVRGPPMIKVFQTRVSVMEGEATKLSCTIISSKDSITSTKWLKNGVQIFNTSHRYQLHSASRLKGFWNYFLIILGAETSDQGNYACVISNAYGTSRGTIELTVTNYQTEGSYDGSIPKIKQVSILESVFSNRLTVQNVGGIRLCCQAIGFNSSVVTKWMIHSITGHKLFLGADDQFLYNDVMMRTYLSSNTSGIFYHLAADTLEYNFTGSYFCLVQDGDNFYKDSLNVTVIGRPSAVAKVTEMNGNLGQEIILTCDVWSSPEPTLLKWYFEDKIISFSQRLLETESYYNAYHFDMKLTITELRASDFGVYACKVYNAEGQTLAVQVIQDLDECSFSNNPCNMICINELGTYRCECESGYVLSITDRNFCQDIDECSLTGSQKVCDHMCQNTNGSYVCTCKEGYTQNGQKCQLMNSGGDPTVGTPSSVNGDEEEEVDENEGIDMETLYSVIGSIAGALVVCLIFIGAFFFCRRRRFDQEGMPMKSSCLNTVAYQSSGESGVKLNSYMADLNKSVLPRDEFPRQRLQLGIDLGQGRFGRVMMARALNISGNSEWEMVAVKTCKHDAMECEKEDLYQELEIMRTIPHHPNIVDYLGCCTQQDPVYIIMEYVSGSNLQQHLRKFRPSNLASQSEELQPLSARDLNTYALHIARGMEHLSQIGIIHRDLAARNILVGGTKVCKICDFGLARNVEGVDVYERSSKGPQPIRWMAPESLADQCFTKESDVWSYGVLLWEIVTLGATPYPGMSAREVISTVMMGKWLSKPLHCKQEMYSMMIQCWDMEPKHRLTFSEICHSVEKLLEKETDYVEFQDYEEAVFSVLDPDAVDERV